MPLLLNKNLIKLTKQTTGTLRVTGSLKPSSERSTSVATPTMSLSGGAESNQFRERKRVSNLKLLHLFIGERARVC